jgi:hypothetical protein
MFVRNLIENKMTRQLDENKSVNEKPLPVHENIRGKKYYQQQSLNFNNDESN